MNKDELHKIEQIIDEALAEFDLLEKADGVQDVAQPAAGIDNAEVLGDPVAAVAAPAPAAAPAPEAVAQESAETPVEESEEEKAKKKAELEAKDGKPAEAPAEAPAAVPAPVEQAPKPEKPEIVEKSDPRLDDLAKSLASFEERFATIDTGMKKIAEAVRKIATRPAAPRKGLAGYAPLAKTEDRQAPVSRRELVDKLLELKFSGKEIDTGLVNRVETGRLSKNDVDALQDLGVIG